MLIKSKGKRAFTEPRYVISILNDNICRCLVIRSGCEAWQRKRRQGKTWERSQNNDEEGIKLKK